MPYTQQDWKVWNSWWEILSPQMKISIRKGDWPETVPEWFRNFYTKVASKLTAEEKILLAIFGENPNLAEIESRPADYVAQQHKPDDVFVDHLLKTQVEDVLQVLTAEEKEVLTLCFGLENGKSMDYPEVAAKIGSNVNAVREIETNALRKVRGRAGVLEKYIDKADV